jgi:GNAT superfamily N-acetyltransferase
MTYSFTVRSAHLNDLKTLVAFALAEADEAERKAKSANIVRAGVRAGLSDPAIARYWVLENAAGDVVGSISVVREWSDWHASYYWWIHSLFIKPAFRGLGLMKLLVDRVKETAVSEQALESMRKINTLYKHLCAKDFPTPLTE